MTDRLTRSQVAEKLGVTTKTLYLWERDGRTSPPERDWRGWRWYSPEQVETLRTLMGLPGEQSTTASRQTETAREIGALPALDISARNRLAGTIARVKIDGVMAEVTLDLGGGNEVVSVITSTSVERLGLKPGVRAVALIKASEVMLAREV